MLVSATRLRLRSARFLPGFAWHAVASNMQAKRSSGFRGMRVVGDRRLVFWTVTGWDDLATMKAFRSNGSHKLAMRTLSGWCDEASYVHWDTAEAMLPSWRTASQRMVADGVASHVRRPSAGQSARDWAYRESRG